MLNLNKLLLLKTGRRKGNFCSDLDDANLLGQHFQRTQNEKALQCCEEKHSLRIALS